MYAAAGGASIASRRKQKRLLLNKRVDAAPVSHPAKAAANVHHPARIRSAPQSSHSSKLTTARPPSLPPPPLATQNRNRHRNEKSQHLLLPISPITFPISPPPLSLESTNSVSFAKSNNFPFPPPSILDLRVSSSITELQCGGQGQGKAAWQGCSRPSPLPLSPASPHGSRGGGENYKTKQCEAHRRWMKRNRIRDASYCYGSSGEEEDEEGGPMEGRGEVSAAVNTVLYAGLGTTALGLVISFVGTGEKGFLSPELRLIGPSLLCAGLLCCLLRVLLCLCLCRCGRCRWHSSSAKIKNKDKEKDSKKDQPQAVPPLLTTSLLPPLPAPVPTSSSTPAVSRGRELLLSPAQLSE